MPANRLVLSVAALPPPTPVTWENTGMALSGEPVNSETPMASSMPQSRALVRKAWSLAAELAPRKLRKMT